MTASWRLKALIAIATIGLGALPNPTSAEEGTAAAQQSGVPTIEAEMTAPFGSADRFTAGDTLTDYTYADTYLGGLINAPLQLVQILHFEQSPDEVFDWVTDGNDEWTLQIETVTWDHAGSETPGQLGIGSVRRCDFRGGAGTAYERVYAVKENRLLVYDLDAERSTVPLPIEDFLVIWTLEDKGDEGTLVMARIYFHEADPSPGGQAAFAVNRALAIDFRNFANTYGGTYVTM